MLTRAQIQRMAQRNGIGMQAQERDYVQHLILLQLYRRTQRLVFKGGTALRMLYRGNRYSEDLDFTADPAGVEDEIAVHHPQFLDQVITDLGSYGCTAVIRNEYTSDTGYSCDFSFQGPLYDGRDHSKGKVRVDISTRTEAISTRRDLIRSEYDDVRPFVVTVLAPEHLLAEKIRALLVRAKPRDLYDVWLLLGQGIVPNLDLIDLKLAIYGFGFSTERLEVALDSVKTGWEQDLRVLLPQPVDFDVVDRGLAPLRRLVAGGS